MVDPPADPPDAGGSDVGAKLTCPSNTAEMQSTLLAARCGNAGCHAAAAPALALDLVSPGLEARLLGAASIGCRGERLLVPGQPEQSELFRKVAHSKPECGMPMPPAGFPGFSADDVECLRRWIVGLTPADAGTDAPAAPETGASPDGGAEVDAGMTCPTGQQACGGRCVDLKGDALNCGGCGTVCGAGTLCSGGTCVRGGCPSGTVNCSGACVDTQTSALHCGACGTVCGSGKTCTAGVCTCVAGTACGGACVDTRTDAKNCGACGKTCGAGEVCTGGACVGCGPTVSFARQVQPILTAGCTTNCHSGRRPAGGLGLEAAVAHAELVNVTSTCGGRKHVAPGAPDTSYLINKLTGIGICAGSVMPKADARLPQAEIDLIRAWICQGAPNN